MSERLEATVEHGHAGDTGLGANPYEADIMSKRTRGQEVKRSRGRWFPAALPKTSHEDAARMLNVNVNVNVRGILPPQESEQE